MLMALVLGFLITFMSTLTTSAETNPTSDMIDKQQKVDKIIFEENKAELAEKGITVTHTAPLEISIEIGVQPFNDETINYLNELLGKENITIVNGQQAFTLTDSNEKIQVSNDLQSSEKSSSVFNPLNLSVAIILICGGVVAVLLGKRHKRIV